MQTELTKSIEVAAEYIKIGGIVAFPTETVYGLGANVFDEAAIGKIFAAKGRPNDNPLIAHIANVNQIAELAANVSKNAQSFIDVFLPAPLTIVVNKTSAVPLIATAGLTTIGIRMPQNKIANEFLAAVGSPVVAPSANLSGRPSPTTWQAVFEDLSGKIDCILLQDETTEIGLESSVVDCTTDPPQLLRSGAISLEQLRKVVPATQKYQLVGGEAPRSPGLRHRHYAPLARVVIVKDLSEVNEAGQAFIGISKATNDFKLSKFCHSPEEYAHELFAFFRECDAAKIDRIYCEAVEEKNIGTALMDRLRRAAEA